MRAKCGDGTPLEHMGRYVPPRDLGRSSRNNASLAEITCLNAGLQCRKIQHFPSITRYGAKPLRGYGLRARQSNDEAAKRISKHFAKSARLCFKIVWNTSVACVAQTGFSRCVFGISSKNSSKHVRRLEFYQEQVSPNLSDYHYLVSRWLPDKNKGRGSDLSCCFTHLKTNPDKL